MGEKNLQKKEKLISDSGLKSGEIRGGGEVVSDRSFRGPTSKGEGQDG